MLEARTPREGPGAYVKMQSPVFPGPELVDREGLLRRYKMLTKNERLTDLAIIIISLQLFFFQLIPKRTSIRKSVRIPCVYHI